MTPVVMRFDVLKVSGALESRVVPIEILQPMVQIGIIML